MKNIAILAIEGTPLSSIALPADILNSAGTLWNQIAGRPIAPLFSVSIVTPDGQPITCNRTITIKPNGSLAALDQPDLIIVAAVGLVEAFSARYGELIARLRRLHEDGVVLASICSGAFLLASTGLLDGRKATTHWGMADLFKKRFPRVRLDISKTVIDEGSLLSSGGAHAGADLALYLIRKIHGKGEAGRCARVLLLDPQRSVQSPYEIMNIRTDHGDQEIVKVQDWIVSNYHRPITVDSLAETGCMSRRTFERRFKKATGESPLRYLQKFRVETAKLLLETGTDSFEHITGRVGYEDASSFRRIFQNSTGLAPSVYREKFRSELTDDNPFP